MLKTSGFPGGPAIHHLSELSVEERLRLHGRGHITPTDTVKAGEKITLTFRFGIGRAPIPTGGRLRVVWRWPYDWGELQTLYPNGEAYLEASSNRRDVRLRASYHFRNDLILWNHGIQMEVIEGRLEEGDRAEFRCGGSSSDALRWRASMIITPEAEFLFLIDPEGSDQWLQLPAVPSFPIVAGTPVRMVVLAPSQGNPHEDLPVTVRVEDPWGNPIRRPDREPQLALASPAGILDITPRPTTDQPAYHFTIRFHESGTHALTATLPGTDLNAVSNPIRIAGSHPRHRIFWGDLHAGQGEIGCGIGSVEHHFDFARHVAGLQFATHQANDHHVTRDMWQTVRRQSEAAHEDGVFVVYPGSEWSADTLLGGDRNIAYLEDEPTLRRSGRFFTEDGADLETDLTTANELLEALKDEPILINLHAGGRPTNLDFHELQIERLVEIHSTHGTAEWFFFDALRRGYRVGVTAGSDGVSGRPGADHPGPRQIRNLPSGITAVYATALTREKLWEALHARRTYATTGERILLDVTIDGHLMGSEFDTDRPPRIELSVEGTQAIEKIDLLCGTEILNSWSPTPFEADERSLRILWGGTQSRGSAPAQRVVWDGELILEGGKVRHFEAVGFCSPDDSIEQTDDSRIRWNSVTAGNRAGVILHLEGGGSALCRFATQPCQFEFPLSRAMGAPLTVAVGGVNRHVIASRPPDTSGPRRVELSYRETRELTGTCPYWIRVTQVDQNQAWSSPIYVTRV